MTILQELAKELGVSDVLLEEAFEEVISSNSHWIHWNGGEQPFQDENQAAEFAKSQIRENLDNDDGFVFVVESNEQNSMNPRLIMQSW